MHITLQRSPGLLGFILSSHLAAILLVMLSQLDIALTVLCLLMILINLLFNARRYGWLDRDAALEALNIKADGRCSLFDCNGQKIRGYRLAGSVMLGPLMVIYLKPSRRQWTRSVLLPRDAVDSEHWRQLRIRLRDPETWAR